MSLPRILLAMLVFVFLAAGANAASYDFTIPVNTPFIDTDGVPAAGAPGEFPDGWGQGSWQADGSSFTKFIVNPELLLPEAITIGEISSISYWTNKDAPASAQDWYFQMYTKPYDGSPGSGWYGNRINAEPYFSVNPNAPAGQWNQWQTGEGDNQLRFYDSSDGSFGSYTDLVWDEFKSEFADQEILYIALGVGSGWAEGFNGLMDGLRIEFANGDIANFNFEANPVPVPAAVWLLGSGLVGLLGVRRKYQK